MKHLTEKARTFVESATVEERIEVTRVFKWLGYTSANKVLTKMNECLNYPKSPRMPNLLVIGDSNNGKTAILNRFNKMHLAYLDPKTDQVINPVVMIQAPPEPDEKRFYNAILEAVFAPTKTSEKTENRYLRVKGTLQKLEVKVLIIDEIHHILAGSLSKQRTFLNVIKHLSNELQIPLIGAGTKLAYNAIQTDLQLSNRFIPAVLPKWSFDQEYKKLLASFIKILPLKKESALIENSIAHKILTLSDGLIGEIAKILELSTILAIEAGTERITNSILSNIDYISPKDRKKLPI
jgi:type II secretory pathway predicted ATPase ExeA